MKFENKIIDGERVVVKTETSEEFIEGLNSTRTLKSLEKYNAERRQAYENYGRAESQPNSIACPDCGKELLDSNPLMTLLGNPPQRNVHCPACGYMGYRIA